MTPLKTTNRRFGLGAGAVFAVLTLAIWWLGDVLVEWLAALAVLFALVGLAFPLVLLPLNRLWMAFAARLMAFNNRIVLGLLYYLVLWPFAAVMRLAGRDPLHRKFEPDSDTYFTPVDRSADAKTLKDMF